MSPDRFRTVISPVYPGKSASARVEVRPGDDPISSSGERAEYAIMMGINGAPIYENQSSGIQFYSLAVQVPEDWRPPQEEPGNGQWGIFLQLHGPDSLRAPPALGFRVTDRFAIQHLSGDLAVSRSSRLLNFSDAGLHPGKWVSFVLRVNWRTDDTGFIEVWRRNEGQADFSPIASRYDIPTLQYSSAGGRTTVGNHYWKTGFYRSTSPQITNMLYLGPQARTDSFTEAVAAFR